MPDRSKKEEGSFFSLLGELLSVPINFLGGLIVGLALPVAAVAGVVGGVYLFTKKVPFFSQVTADEATGERSLELELMSPEEAQAAFSGRLAELKETWARVRADLTEMARRAGEEPLSLEELSSEEVDIEA
jgi:hypothetical protein